MNCYRCGIELGAADARNADYVIAEDTKKDEPREVLIAYKHNDTTRSKLSRSEVISDEDYDQEEITDSSQLVEVAKTKTEYKIKTIQKTGVVCPSCYKPTDFIIWGVHK